MLMKVSRQAENVWEHLGTLDRFKVESDTCTEGRRQVWRPRDPDNSVLARASRYNKRNFLQLS